MIEKIIEWSARNKFFIYLGVFFAVAAGLWALKNTPLDAIPDLSDVQVIVFTDWPGRSPILSKIRSPIPLSRHSSRRHTSALSEATRSSGCPLCM